MEVRKLDIAESASVNLMELNNTIISMRKTVKTAKVYVSRCLIRKLQKLKDQPNSENKNDNLKREMKIVKSLNCDKISKYALGNVTKFEDICKRPNCPLEMKTLARIADNSIIQKKVNEFRESHADWKSLAMFLMTKQSGRRFHKRKNMKKKRVVIANKTAGEAMIENFVEAKMSGKDVELVVGREIKEVKQKICHVDSNKMVGKTKLVDSDRTTLAKTSDESDEDLDNEQIKPAKKGKLVPVKVQTKSDIDVQNKSKSVNKDKRGDRKTANKSDIVTDKKIGSDDSDSSDEILDESDTSPTQAKKRKIVKKDVKTVVVRKVVNSDSSESSDSDAQGDNDECISDSDGGNRVIQLADSNSDMESEIDEKGAYEIPTFDVKDLSDKSKLPKQKLKKKTKKRVTLPIMSDKKLATKNINEGELIVKRLDLNEFTNDGELNIICDQSLFVDDSDSNKITTKRSRDRFFDGSDNSDDNEDNYSDNDGNDDHELHDNKPIMRREFKSSFVSLKQSDEPTNLTNKKRNLKQDSRSDKFSERKRDYSNPRDNQRYNRSIDYSRDDDDANAASSSIWSRDKLKPDTNEPSMLDVSAQLRIAPPTGTGVNHPSWTASRKRKECAKLQPFQGKKTTFNDSD